MTLVGVAAYYISAPTADSDFARPVTSQVRRELQPLITPTLGVMRLGAPPSKPARPFNAKETTNALRHGGNIW